MSSRLRVAACLLAACSGRSTNPADRTYLGTVPTPAFAVSSQIATDRIEAPFNLTASDGSGLQLSRVEAKAVLEGPLAFTELHLYFHNAEDRVREGTFSITLPDKAAVSRFAMENEGKWMEAEVVEKLKARRAYEDFLHRRQDPALLEKAEGNQFTARVFPIPAKGDKHLVISFSQDVPGARYTLPLRGLPKVERVDVRLSLLGSDGRKTEQVLAERNWQPDRDFTSTAPVADAVGAGSIVAAQLTVLDPHGQVPHDKPTAMTILVDTSASRTLGFAKTAAAVDGIVRDLHKRYGDIALDVVAFDQRTERIFSGRASKWGADAKQVLLARGAAGASDMGQALAWLGQHSTRDRLVVVGDGIITAGAKVDDVAAAIKNLGFARVDFVLSGGLRDDQVASQLVRASRRPGAVLDAAGGVDDVVAALGEQILTNVAIDVRGASWVYPRTIASARPGSHVMVYARMPQTTATIDVGVNAQRRSVRVVGGTKQLVDRAFAATEIGELEIQLANAATDRIPALKAEIAKKSVAARVISSQTALLVLETEADYDRYQIDRTALADILEVGPDGIVTRNRKGTQLEIAGPKIEKPPMQRVQRKLEKLKQADGKERKPQKKLEEKKELSKRLADKRGGEELEGDDDGDRGDELMKKSLERAPVETTSDPAPAIAAPPPPPPPTTPRPAPQPLVEGYRPAPQQIVVESEGRNREAWPPKNKPAPLQGELAEIAKLIAKNDGSAALARARAWHEREPGNVLAWIGLGEVLEARKDLDAAARAYGSIIDLFPGRADLRRWAGERLERVASRDERARELAVDTYRRAVADRPDHMTGHRLLAYALLRANRHQEAFTAILAGVDQKYPSGRFNGGERILKEDAGLIGAAFAAALPTKLYEITGELAKRNLAIAAAPSTRFILYWETDANDVDFHIQDARGGHAFYSSKQLPSGGELYADVTNGYGPECFAIPGNASAGPYRLSIDYYSQGPMGYGMGLLQIVRHDGRGKLTFEDRPYIIMADHAIVDLGTIQ